MPRIGLVVVLALGLLVHTAAAAQEAGKLWRVGFLSPYSADFDKGWRAALRNGLRELGYSEGENVVMVERHTEGRHERFQELAAELASSRIDVFVVNGNLQAIRAAEKASSAIPIVFIANPDPVGLWLVASLARPGGNMTAVSDFHAELAPTKRVELLKEAVPSLSRLAVLYNKTPLGLRALRGSQAAAAALRLTVVPVEIREGRAAMISTASSPRSRESGQRG